MRFSNFFILLLSTSAWSMTDLPKLVTKQAMDNIRFISYDGKYTYFVKKSGPLALTTNFKTTEFFENPTGTNYLITSSESRKRIGVEVISGQHTNLDINKLHDLYTLTWGGALPLKVGMGRDMRFHLDDEMVSFYNPKTKIITVQNLKLTDRKYEIQLSIKHNAFFFPHIEMTNPETVIYTDVNDKGQSALIAYNLISKKLTVVYKAAMTGTRIELCKSQDQYYLGEFSYDDADRGSLISTISPESFSFTTLYKSPDNDLGNMVCRSDKIFFIKTLAEDKTYNIKDTDVAELNTKSTEVRLLTNIEKATQLIDMDGRVLLPFRDTVFVVQGTNDLSNTDQIKAIPKKVGP